jgi:hypothetical protein
MKTACSVTSHGAGGTVRFTPKVFRKSGDDFCRLLLSTGPFVEETTTADDAVQQRVARHIESCSLVLGVVAEPSFAADAQLQHVVFAMATAFNGMVFNGHNVIDAHRLMLV